MLAGVLVLLAGCSTSSETSTADDEAAIAEFNRQYLRAINSGDIEALARLTM